MRSGGTKSLRAGCLKVEYMAFTHGSKQQWKGDQGSVITVKSRANPKRDGSKAHQRFALYRSGMTVGDYVRACKSTHGRKMRS